ncbi:MAG: hypothetical protein WBG92_12800 [Thiohalocapsa sp.]
MNRLRIILAPILMIPLASCVAPGVQGPGGTVQGTANVENLERQSPVTPAPSDAQNATTAAYYGSGPRYYPRHYYYGDCRGRDCDYPYRRY